MFDEIYSSPYTRLSAWNGGILESASDDDVRNLLARSIKEARSKKELYAAFLAAFGIYEDAEIVAESAAIFQNIYDVCMDEKSTVMDILWAKDEFPKVTSNTVLESLSEDEDSQKGLDMMEQATPEQGVQYLQSLGEQYLLTMKQSQDRFYALGEECKDLRAQLDGLKALQGNEWWEAKKRIFKENKDLIDSLGVREREIFNMTAKALIEASPISQEQAEAWIKDHVTIDNTASNYLTRIKYPRADFKRDLAEVYRIVGGKIGPVTFIHDTRKGKTRSYANGTDMIAIQGEHFSKKVLFHECGHLAENSDKIFDIVCHNFIENRATGTPQQLEKMMGIGFRDDERAYPDNFINPYIGKLYTEGSEVLSVGLETLVDKDGPFLLLDDPDYLKLIAGICVHKSVHTDLKNDDATMDAESKKRLLLKSWTKAIEKVSGPKWGKAFDITFGMDKNYRLRKVGANTCIYAQNADSKLICLFGTKPAWARAAVYLLIAEDRGIIPPIEDKKTVEERAYHYVYMLRDKIVPSWFNPDKALPEV